MDNPAPVALTPKKVGELRRLYEAATRGPLVIQTTMPADGWDGFTVMAQPSPAMRGFTNRIADFSGPQANPTRKADVELYVKVKAALPALLTLAEAAHFGGGDAFVAAGVKRVMDLHEARRVLAEHEASCRELADLDPEEPAAPPILPPPAAEGDWRDISDAPVDGTRVDLKAGNLIAEGCYYGLYDNGWSQHGATGWVMAPKDFRPTHFRLTAPAAPAPAGGETWHEAFRARVLARDYPGALAMLRAPAQPSAREVELEEALKGLESADTRMTSNLERADWRPSRTHYESARNVIRRAAQALSRKEA